MEIKNIYLLRRSRNVDMQHILIEGNSLMDFLLVNFLVLQVHKLKIQYNARNTIWKGNNQLENNIIPNIYITKCQASGYRVQESDTPYLASQ